MTSAQSVLAGMAATAEMLRSIAPMAATKTVATPRTGTTTLAADPDLQLILAPNATYLYIAAIFYSYAGTAGNGDMQLAWQLPSGGSMSASLLHYGNTGATQNTLNLDYVSASASNECYGATTAGGDRCALATGTVYSGGNGGIFAAEWAQHASDVSNATSVMAGSVLAAWQIT